MPRLHSKAEERIGLELQALADAWMVKLEPEQAKRYITVLSSHNPVDVCEAILGVRAKATGYARLALPHVFILVQRTKDAYMKRTAGQRLRIASRAEAA